MAKPRWIALFGVWLMLVVAGHGQPAPDGEQWRWYRGQLHAHTYWSDGRGFPEQAIAAYQKRGYQFLAITDHNRFADNTNTWRDLAAREGSWPPKVPTNIFNAYLQAFGGNWVESKTNGSAISVRLKTYAECKARFDAPGKFILLPGVELTQELNGAAIHMNYINLPLLIPSHKNAALIEKIKGKGTVGSVMASNVAEVEAAAARLGAPCVVIYNHPFWVYYDTAPQSLITCPEIRFFEICNNGIQYAPDARAPDYGPERFWDIVNAFRCLQGQPLLYGIGSDDAHYYDAQRIAGDSGVGDAWIMVRASDLTPQALIAAMLAGDFYASCGVLLDEVAFTSADNNLRVKAHAEPGGKYRISFIVTKRDFDEEFAEILTSVGNKGPVRAVPLYSDEIGRTVKTVEGCEASYRMEADDLYVRAQVESDRPCRATPHFHPKRQTAWTQPYARVTAGASGGTK